MYCQGANWRPCSSQRCQVDVSTCDDFGGSALVRGSLGSQAMEWSAFLENGGSFPIFGVEGRL